MSASFAPSSTPGAWGEVSRERAAVIGYSLIILPDQEKWSGDGAGIKAITGGDAVSVHPKYHDAYSTHIPAVILAVNNNPMRFTDRSGGVSRRRVLLHFPEIIPADERDPQLKEKISGELAVIVRQLMQQFSQPQQARSLLQPQQNSDEAMRIKRDADPMVYFCSLHRRQTRYTWGTPASGRFSPDVISITLIWPTWRPAATRIRSA